MQYAFMSFSAPRADLQGLIDLAVRFGYQGLEPRVGSAHAHGLEPQTEPAALKEAAARVAGAGLSFCCVATGIRLVSEPSRLDEIPGDLITHAEMARRLDSPLIRVFGGPLPDGMSRSDAVETAVVVLEKAAPALERLGVTAVLETHDHWCDPRDVVLVMERVGYPNVGVNWDIMHPVRVAGFTVERSFEALRRWIRHVHVHDGLAAEKLEFRPMGEGAVDHRTALGLLAGAGYDGFLSGEWIGWETAETHLPREIRTLKSYEERGGVR